MGKNKEKRFEIIHQESKVLTGSMIIRDKQTGVNYLYVASGYGGGLSPLLDKDGKPIIN